MRHAIAAAGEMMILLRACMALACFAVVVGPLPIDQADAAVEHGIVVLNGQFGTLRYKRKLDITAKLQQMCGGSSDRCDVFCSETSFGLYRLGPKAICRVAYRCADGSVRAIEAAREEPIMLRCGEDADPVSAATASDTPPAYTPPSGR